MNRSLTASLLLILLLLGCMRLAVAQQPLPDATVAAAPPQAPHSATVTFMNRAIATLRAPMLSYDAADRAAAAMRRIQEIDARQPVQRLKTAVHKISADTLAIYIDRDPAFAITRADLDLEQGLDEEAAQAAARLQEALDAAREGRSTRVLLLGIGRVLGATVLLAGILWLVFTLLARLVGGVRRWSTRFGWLSGTVTAVLAGIVRLATWLGAAHVVMTWLVFCLRQFPYTEPWGSAVRKGLLAYFKHLFDATLEALPGLGIVVVVVLIVRATVRGLGMLFDAIQSGRTRAPAFLVETAVPTRRLLTLFLWAFALVVCFPYLPGSGTPAFAGLSIFFGALISLGSTGVVGQITSGLTLTYARALQPGDYVRVGETEGTVIAVELLSTKIRTPKLEEVTIPNSVLVGTVTKNYSRLARPHGVIIYTSVTIGYDTPWRQVEGLLLLAADRTACLRKDPPPFVYRTRLDDFYIEHQLNAYLEIPNDRVPALSALHANILDTFNEYGVQIMSPHYLGDPAQPKVVPPEEWHELPSQPERGGDHAGAERSNRHVDAHAGDAGKPA